MMAPSGDTSTHSEHSIHDQDALRDQDTLHDPDDPHKPNNTHDPPPPHPHNHTSPIEIHPARLTHGLRARPLTFLRAGQPTSTHPPAPPSDGPRIAAAYLALFPPAAPRAPSPPRPICPTCHRPVRPGHAQSLAHHLALPAAPLPSTVDRSRLGLAVLQAHGWDPDAHAGLGARGDGRLEPVVPEERGDKRGVGAVRRVARVEKRGAGRLMHAGEVRRVEARKVERGRRLEREMFGRGEEKVERYLSAREEWE